MENQTTKAASLVALILASQTPARAQDVGEPRVQVCAFAGEATAVAHLRTDNGFVPLGEWSGASVSLHYEVLLLVRNGLVIQMAYKSSVLLADGKAHEGSCVDATLAVRAILDTVASEEQRALLAYNESLIQKQNQLIEERDAARPGLAAVTAERNELEGCGDEIARLFVVRDRLVGELGELTREQNQLRRDVPECATP
jgi:hypothetical protein